MSCTANRKRFFDRISGITGDSAKELERIYQACINSTEPLSPTEALQIKLKAMSMLTIMAGMGLALPIHSQKGSLPADRSLNGYAEVYNHLYPKGGYHLLRRSLKADRQNKDYQVFLEGKAYLLSLERAQKSAAHFQENIQQILGTAKKEGTTDQAIRDIEASYPNLFNCGLLSRTQDKNRPFELNFTSAWHESTTKKAFLSGDINPLAISLGFVGKDYPDLASLENDLSRNARSLSFPIPIENGPMVGLDFVGNEDKYTGLSIPFIKAKPREDAKSENSLYLTEEEAATGKFVVHPWQNPASINASTSKEFPDGMLFKKEGDIIVTPSADGKSFSFFRRGKDGSPVAAPEAEYNAAKRYSLIRQFCTKAKPSFWKKYPLLEEIYKPQPYNDTLPGWFMFPGEAVIFLAELGNIEPDGRGNNLKVSLPGNKKELCYFDTEKSSPFDLEEWQRNTNQFCYFLAGYTNLFNAIQSGEFKQAVDNGSIPREQAGYLLKAYYNQCEKLDRAVFYRRIARSSNKFSGESFLGALHSYDPNILQSGSPKKTLSNTAWSIGCDLLKVNTTPIDFRDERIKKAVLTKRFLKSWDLPELMRDSNLYF
ncbi:MAG: hypothetical protein AB9888_13045 [Bacteroidales bacterium]